MAKFKEVPITPQRLNTRKPLYGVGINDAEYNTQTKQGNKNLVCPFYRVWSGMLTRCYSEDYHERRPRHRGVSVCDEWLTFSNFKLWMELQDWRSKALDKDILSPECKTYSPDTARFVHPAVNTVVASCTRCLEAPPQVASNSNGYSFKIIIAGERKRFGPYATSGEAISKYYIVKAERVAVVGSQYAEAPEVRVGLFELVQKLKVLSEEALCPTP